MARKYQITFTDDHLLAILKGTEFFERIAMGQFREICEVADPGFKLPRKDREAAEHLLALARRFLMPDLQGDNAYRGIHSKRVSDDARVCYDFLQVVRHQLAWDREPEGGMTINFDVPLRTSERHAFVEIEPLPKEEGKEPKEEGKKRRKKSKREL